MNDQETVLCGEDDIADLLEAIGADEQAGSSRLDALLERYPNDPRLLFLKGSLLAGDQDYAEAEQAMRRAVDVAPGYDLARFQLGFLRLTMGEPYAAQEAWGPLHGLAADNYLRVFVEGLCHLIRDEFPQAVASLEKGIALNRDNLPMNNDMRLIIEEIGSRRSERSSEEEAPVSAAQLLLQQAALRNTRH